MSSSALPSALFVFAPESGYVCVRQLLELCPELRWHFIGRLQRNKAAKVARLSGLAVLETLDSARLADTLNAARERADLGPLRVMVQVNTSDEPSESRPSPATASETQLSSITVS